jgi:TRAP-type C4-dicarboxylate transport system substrate-binding protein
MNAYRMIVAAVALAAMCSAGPSRAEEKTLLISSILPLQTPYVAGWIKPWVDHLNETGKGIVHFDLRPEPTLANPGNFYDRVVNDVVQIAWGTQSQVGGKFPLSDMMGLPFETDKSEQASVAFVRLLKTGLLDAEYSEVDPLFVYAYPQNGLHFAKRPASVENLSGQKIQAINKTNAEIVSRMGAAPITLNIAEAYTALQRGTIDATIVPWPAIPPFKLAEVTTFHLEAPVGGAPGMFFMAKKKRATLPADVLKVIDENSGEAPSRSWGTFLDGMAKDGRASVLALGAEKQTVMELTPEQAEKWRTALRPVTQEWVAKTPGADKALPAFRELLAKVKAGS